MIGFWRPLDLPLGVAYRTVWTLFSMGRQGPDNPTPTRKQPPRGGGLNKLGKVARGGVARQRLG